MAVLTIFSALTGLLGSAIPEVVGFFKKKQENKQTLAMLDREMALQGQTNDHELIVMDKQAEIALQEHSLKIEEIDVSSSNGYDLGLLDIQKEEVKKDDFVGKLVRSVRPVIAYGFFGLYATIKVLIAASLVSSGAATAAIALIVWTELDASIFVMILSYFFGKRSFEKMSGK